MSIIRRRNHEVPSLNTASLPDLLNIAKRREWHKPFSSFS